MTAATPASAPRARPIPAAVWRWARPLLVAAVLVATLAALAIKVLPTRTWLAQREAIASTTAELDELRAEREALEARVGVLETDAEIEAIARADYGLVKPGEEAYAVLEPPVEPVTLPPIWPFGAVFTPPAPVVPDLDAGAPIADEE